MYEYNVTTNLNEKVVYVLCFEFFIKLTIRFYNNLEFMFDHFVVENNYVKVILTFRPLIYFKKKMAAGI